MATKNYIQFTCGEYPFLLCTDAITEIVNNNIPELRKRCEEKNGTLFYAWNHQSIPVVNLNKRFGLDENQSTHQLILDGFQKRDDSRIMVVIGEVIGIVDIDETRFQPVQPLAGEFSRLVDATFNLGNKNWLRIREEYFY